MWQIFMSLMFLNEQDYEIMQIISP
jgi:hypothetical protein